MSLGKVLLILRLRSMAHAGRLKNRPPFNMHMANKVLSIGLGRLLMLHCLYSEPVKSRIKPRTVFNTLVMDMHRDMETHHVFFSLSLSLSVTQITRQEV